jgi:hypothetical protein
MSHARSLFVSDGQFVRARLLSAVAGHLQEMPWRLTAEENVV